MAYSQISKNNEENPTNIIRYLNDAGVFVIIESQDQKTVTFFDGCDEYYWARLTKDEFSRLIYQLIVIKDKMK